MKKILFLQAVALGLTLSVSTLAEDLKLPKDVQKIIGRKGCCGHWSGEEPNSPERRKQIEEALKECACDRFDSDL